MNNIDKKYQELLQDILDNGIEKKDRTGTGTISVFGKQIRHKMSEGFPLLTTKKMAWRTMVTELLWFLQGSTNIKYLVDNNCHIWDGDAYQAYLKNMDKQFPHILCFDKEEFINKIKTDDEFANKWGELGPVYGAQWRKWGRKNAVNYDLENVKSSDKVKVMDLIRDGGDYSKYDVKVTYQNNSIDQIQNLISDLKTNPDSRRLMVNAWNVGEVGQMVLPPCHYGFQVYTRELNLEEKWEQYIKSGLNVEINGTPLELKHMGTPFYPKSLPQRAISLMWNQRSVDTLLGLPFNIASYGLLLTMIADEVNMVPDELIGNLGDTHLYLNHIEQAKEQIGRDLTDEERYNIWFDNNYETGMERFFDPNRLPDFDDSYYEPTPKRTREPYPLPNVSVKDGIHCSSVNDVILENYQSHPAIKAPLSN
jgi:thymidylate synthase